jgi:hypothetical protein
VATAAGDEDTAGGEVDMEVTVGGDADTADGADAVSGVNRWGRVSRVQKSLENMMIIVRS